LQCLKSYLKQEYNKAVNVEQTDNCQKNCQSCGVKGCNLNPSSDYADDIKDVKFDPKQANPVNDYRLTLDDFKTNYPLGSEGIFENLRYRIKYTVGEAFRYAGHLDRVRSIYRTLRRSELPIAYTQGFSPHPVVSFGPPLPVGVTSSGEYLDLEIARSYNGNIVRDLGLFLPHDMRIVQTRLISRRTDSLGKSCNLAQYEIKNIAWELNQELLEKQKKQIPGIKTIDFTDNQTMKLMLMIAPKMKLFDILVQLYQKDDAQVRCLNIERKDFYVVKNQKVYSPMDDDFSP
jgi:radical SAM-linked protein